jgi:hypothetical protein
MDCRNSNKLLDSDWLIQNLQEYGIKFQGGDEKNIAKHYIWKKNLKKLTSI